jgi:hypothetical protein
MSKDKMKRIFTKVLLRKSLTQINQKNHQGFQISKILKKDRLRNKQIYTSTKVQETLRINGDLKPFFTNSNKGI